MTSYEIDKSNLSFSEKKIIAFLAKLENSKHFELYLFFGENDKLHYELENDKF